MDINLSVTVSPLQLSRNVHQETAYQPRVSSNTIAVICQSFVGQYKLEEYLKDPEVLCDERRSAGL